MPRQLKIRALSGLAVLPWVVDLENVVMQSAGSGEVKNDKKQKDCT